MVDVVGNLNSSSSSLPFTYSSPIQTFNDAVALLSSPARLLEFIKTLPGSGVVWRYIESSHQNDPARTFLELLLFLFVVYTYAKGRTKGERGSTNYVKLSEREIDELVDEWIPEPLVVEDAELASLPSPPVIIGPPTLHPRIVNPPPGHPTGLITSADGAIKDMANYNVALPEKTATNLASANFSGLALNERVKEKAVECLRSYGVGSCGPFNFYGFFDVHMELENALAAFLGTEAAMIYPQGFTTICSAIPTFSKRGDIIVADKGVNFSIQKGIQISRSKVRWYDHNNMDSLEEVLETIERESKRTKAPLTRKFLVTEGLFEGDGQICDLPRIIELKNKYKYRLMLDESWSVGVLGRTGRGVSELYGIPSSDIDILMGSLAIGLCAGGGFCAGSSVAMAHQRINSAAYVYSASLPPLLAVAATEGISFLSGVHSTNGQLPLATLGENISALRGVLDKFAEKDALIVVPSSPFSPLVHVHIHPRKSSTMTFYEQERLLQEIVDECLSNGVLVSRTKKVWKQEATEGSPSLRLCVSAGLTKKEVEKAANVLRQAITAKLGKNSKKK